MIHKNDSERIAFLRLLNYVWNIDLPSPQVEELVENIIHAVPGLWMNNAGQIMAKVSLNHSLHLPDFIDQNS